MPKAERAAAEAQLDQALLELTVDRTWGGKPPNDGDSDGDVTAPSPRIPSRTATEEPEITMEADAPPDGKGDDDAEENEPEISIENVVEMEAEAPMNEHEHSAEVITTMDDNSARITEVVKETSSQTMTLTVAEPAPPEILIVKPGRAITADDTKLVAGSIDTTDKPAKRAKRQTDAPD